MNSKYCYVEPNVIGYKINEILDPNEQNILDDVLKFSEQLANFIDIIDSNRMKLIIPKSLEGECYGTSPLLPFRLNKSDEHLVRAYRETFLEVLPRIFANAYQFDSECDISDETLECIYDKDDYYLNFIRTLFNRCELIEGDVWDFLVKSFNTKYFTEEEFEVTCNGKCGNNLTSVFDCISVSTLQLRIYEILIEKYNGFTTDAELRRLIVAYYNVELREQNYPGANLEPYKISCSKRFYNQFKKVVDSKVKMSVLDSITKRAYNICEPIHDEDIKRDHTGKRRFYVDKEGRRIHYRKKDNEIHLVNYGDHDDDL